MNEDSHIRIATEAGQFTKTGFLAVTRVIYIAVLLSIAVALIVGLVSLLTWSSYADNLRETFSIAKSAATAVVGLVAASVAVDSLRQKRNADDQDAALARLQWAMDLTTSDLERERDLGWDLLAGLIRTPGLLAIDEGLTRSIRKYVDEEKPSDALDDDHGAAAD